MTRKRFMNKTQASQVLAEKRKQIKELERHKKWLEEENEDLEAENDSMASLVGDMGISLHRQMATTKYIVLVNLMLDSLEKTLEDYTPMTMVIKKAIVQYKKAMSEGMLHFKFDGDNCIYTPTDKDDEDVL